MFERDCAEFFGLVDQIYELHQKSLSAEAKALFFKALQPYSLDTVKRALTAQMRDPQRGQYPPKPADVIAQIQSATGNDGRPGAEEAWAIALTSQDEAETVVWTQEMAEAFALCSPVLKTGDEVGARMAFKEAYLRLVTAARASGLPAKWSPSLGWDLRKREAALTRATSAGLLPAPVSAGLLPPPADAVPNDPKARQQIDKIKKMMSDMNAEKSREAELHAQRERQATQEAKERLIAQVVNFRKKDAA